MRPEHAFEATLWLWDARRQDNWTFVTVPPPITEALEDEADALGPRGGFGSVPVTARLGTSQWSTSVFPDKASGCFVLPVKRAIRQANQVHPGDTVTVHLRLTASP